MTLRTPGLSRLSKWLTLETRPPNWQMHAEYARKADLIVQAFYLFTLLIFVRAVNHLQRDAAAPDGFSPLWPVAWMEWVGIETAAKLLIPAYIAVGILAVLASHSFFVRLATSLLILQFAAFSNSWGSINHGYHELFWISVCFLFLPNMRRDLLMRSRVGRMQLLTCVYGAMGLILLFYSLSGAYKCVDAVQMLLAGEKGGFSPYAMAETLAARTLQSGTNPIYADIVLDNPLLGWPMFLSLYYAELVAIVILFRPALHRLWGAGLIIFHFGTIVFMEISFELHIVINALLFLMSPYAPARFDARQAAASLPVFGLFFRHLLGWRADGFNTPTANAQGSEGPGSVRL